MGSGYKEGLNLILTSDEFNKQTMKKAEDEIQDNIIDEMKANKDKFVTFDLTVSATYEVLESDSLIETLAKTHKGMTDSEKKALLEELQQLKQHPRRCEVVFYKVEIKDELKNTLSKSFAQTEHGDTWLNTLFNK